MLNRPTYYLPIEQNPMLILALKTVRRAVLDTKLKDERLRAEAAGFLQEFVPEVDPSELSRLYHVV